MATHEIAALSDFDLEDFVVSEDAPGIRMRASAFIIRKDTVDVECVYWLNGTMLTVTIPRDRLKAAEE